MHTCEALIASFEASGETHYLQRAVTLARNITMRQAGPAGARATRPRSNRLLTGSAPIAKCRLIHG